MGPGADVGRLLDQLGGWPDYLDGRAVLIGNAMLIMLKRNRMIDEAVFFMVIRYAVHRAAYDELSMDIRTAPPATLGSEFLSGKEQARFAHANRCRELERELLVAPRERQKSLGSAQTSFMDALDKGDDTAVAAQEGPGKVMPFRPLGPRGKIG